MQNSKTIRIPWLGLGFIGITSLLTTLVQAKPVAPSQIMTEAFLHDSQRLARLDLIVEQIHQKLGFASGVQGSARLSVVVADLNRGSSTQNPEGIPWGSDLNMNRLFCGASTLKAPAAWAVLQKVREGELTVDLTGAETPVDLKPGDGLYKPNSRRVLLQDLEKALRPSDNAASFRMVMSLDADPATALRVLNQFFWDTGLRNSGGGLFLGSAYNSQGPSQPAPPEIGDTSQTTRQVVTPRLLTKYFALLDRCRVFPTDSSVGVDLKLCEELKELMRFRYGDENAKINSTPDRMAKLVQSKYGSATPRPKLIRKTGSLWGQSLPTCYLDSGLLDRGEKGRYAFSLICQETPQSAKSCNLATIEKAATLLDSAMDEYFSN